MGDSAQRMSGAGFLLETELKQTKIGKKKKQKTGFIIGKQVAVLPPREKVRAQMHS